MPAKKKDKEETEIEEVVETEEEKPTKKKAVKKTTKKEKNADEAGQSADKGSAGESADTLIPLDDYIRSGTYIGTKVITPHTRPFIYRRRNDGIAIINTNIIDEKLKEAARFLGDFKPESIIVVCKREAGWRAVKLFSELTGIRVFTKKYPAGIITNTTLPDFFETEVIVVCDPWIDKNALKDAVMMKKKVLGLCDTNNYAFNIDRIIPCNNKSNKSLGVIFYILAREYLKIQGIDKKMPTMEEFVGEELGEFIKDRKEEKAKKRKDEEIKKGKSRIEELMKVKEE